MAIVETIINVSSIGQSRFQVTYSLSRHTMTAEVVMARSPESVVASPYVGRKNGSIVMMKMPKPKPVVRCTKLAPMLNKNMAMTRLLISIEDIGHVVGWRQSPCALSIHDECEVLVVVIGIVGEDIEHHASIEFLTIHF